MLLFDGSRLIDINPMLPYPIAPQLAQLRGRLPSGLQWLYEPKYDGFRCLLFKSGSRIRLQSTQPE